MASVTRGSPLRRCAVLVLALACATGRLTVARAQGQGDAGAAQRRRQASEHVKRGDEFKDGGDYEAAAREYQQAYALVPHPVLFFNLAQVYRLKGDREQALEYYERYLAGDPDGRASGQARHFAAQLRAEIERERQAAREQRRQGARRAPPTAGVDARVDTHGEDDRGAAGRGLRVGGLVLAGAGVVSLGVGVVFGLRARRISDDIDGHDEGAWPDDLLRSQAEGAQAEQNMFILTASGVAAVAAGGLLYYMGHRARRDAEERALTVTPVAGEQIGLAVFGRF